MQEYELVPAEIEKRLGPDAFAAWLELEGWLAENYDMDLLWGSGGKKWERELKYRKGGKTLCGFYPADGFFGFMVIFGKAERVAIEKARGDFSQPALTFYDSATTCHDGKWVMLEIRERGLVADAKRMVLLKRRPNREK